MTLLFRLLARNRTGEKRKNTVYLSSDNWDDYSFKTTFYAELYDEQGESHSLGQVKIGYLDQEHGWTLHSLDDQFSDLSPKYFSLGQSTDYYKKVAQLPYSLRKSYLDGIQDIVWNEERLREAKEEKVFRDSLLRGINYSTISEQFKRVLRGGAILEEFHFAYKNATDEKRVSFYLEFDVIPNKKPSTNIHVLIGRNGTGKTTLLNGMIDALVGDRPQPVDAGRFFNIETDERKPLPRGYFSSLISVSFSAFDPFTPPPDRYGDIEDLRYSYIGLKTISVSEFGRESHHKDMDELGDDFVSSLTTCFGLEVKRDRWHNAIRYLESDLNFEEMDLGRLLEVEDVNILQKRARNTFTKMSSGHAIVLLTITKLIERAEEKTLILMDEPESHLHPPLLSAFMRALSDFLNEINGIAIIATHSPVVLQEVPKSCVWKIHRSRLEGDVQRPEMETFAENVGTLTREVFSLEVTTSGFHDLLSQSVSEGRSYEHIIQEYEGQIGLEGKAILHALLMHRNRTEGL